jgi:hypothetical protein
MFKAPVSNDALTRVLLLSNERRSVIDGLKSEGGSGRSAASRWPERHQLPSNRAYGIQVGYRKYIERMFPHMAFIVESPKALGYRCLATGLTYTPAEENRENDTEPLMEWSDGQAERQRLLVVTGPADWDEATHSWTWEGVDETAGTWRARPVVFSDASWIYPDQHFADFAEFLEICDDAMAVNIPDPEDAEEG